MESNDFLKQFACKLTSSRRGYKSAYAWKIGPAEESWKQLTESTLRAQLICKSYPITP
jgi:hypothetical protein